MFSVASICSSCHRHLWFYREGGMQPHLREKLYLLLESDWRHPERDLKREGQEDCQEECRGRSLETKEQRYRQEQKQTEKQQQLE